MFERHFGVKENPFPALSDPASIFASSELDEAVQHFFYARGNQDAIMLLTGEVGTGKTTAVRAICRKLPEKTPLAVIENGPLDPEELLDELFRSFRLRKRGAATRRELLRRLESGLKRFVKSGRHPVLIVDEAHLLETAVLEEVRLLTNLRYNGHPMIQVCLVGQAEIAERLREHSLRPLRQRISVRYTMHPLSREETTVYLADRMQAAGSDAPDKVFEHAAARAVHQISGGLPREINILANQALLNAYVDHDRVVRERHVRSAVEHYEFEGASVPDIEAPPQEQPAPTPQPAPIATIAPHALPSTPAPTPASASPPAATPEPPKPELNVAAISRHESLEPEPPEDSSAARITGSATFPWAAAVVLLVAAALVLIAVLADDSGGGVQSNANPVESPSRPDEVSQSPAPTPVADAPAPNGVEVTAAPSDSGAPDEPPLSERYPSALEVTSAEPAVVWLDDQRLGMSPGRFAPIPPGQYQVRLDAGDGRVFEQEVVLTLGSTTYVNAASFAP